MIESVIEDIKHYRIGMDTAPDSGLYAGAVVHLPTQDEVEEWMWVDVLDILEAIKDREVDPAIFGVTKEQLRERCLEDILADMGWHVSRGDNTYNWGSPISNDIVFHSAYPPGTYNRSDELSEDEYLIIRVHRWGDVRGNYSRDIMLRDNFFNWIYNEDDIFSGSRLLVVDGHEYVVDFDIFSEEIRVWDPENSEDVGSIYTTDIDDAIESIYEITHADEIRSWFDAFERWTFMRPFRVYGVADVRVKDLIDYWRVSLEDEVR